MCLFELIMQIEKKKNELCKFITLKFLYFLEILLDNYF
jgi:hypothetical protein